MSLKIRFKKQTINKLMLEFTLTWMFAHISTQTQSHEKGSDITAHQRNKTQSC